MTPARRHRERIAAIVAAADPKLVVSSAEGGRTPLVPVARTPAMNHLERTAAAAIVAAPENSTSAESRVAAQIVLRLTHDLRRLKEIRSIDRKIDAKREMLPEYEAWVNAVIEADAGVGAGTAADVVPTYMVWLIDTGAFMAALDLVPFLLRHKVDMPKRYERDVPTIVVELIADAALKAQNAGECFVLDVLSRANDLTADLDIHDQVRAKLLKAIGIEQLRIAEDMDAADSAVGLETTLATLREAQRLNDRIGVRDRIKRADKLLAAVNAAAAPTDTSGTPAA
ncbi:phage terminase small subunit [Novosphingobium guangzhouense]|uniref:Terminase n=1 Tax=Novosphingobium guangzhouense TaxID=1850347 RepID=A0A2K2G0A5_9SPHN|nr:phage terminase small subunit [Novosphingobium guangzhouense]PNU04457.1 terminase [Novosphingobium guangzhouense]